MKEKILETLKEIETIKKFKILHACETGSRAWGFPSSDSDYDVRFIYRHETDWYLSLNKHSDNIEFMTDEGLDVSGWDLKKTLIMLKRSNAALIERFQSPIEYFSENAFKEDFKKLIESYYSPTAVFYHHYSLARKFREVIKDSDAIRLKNCFYLIRSLLSCRWVINSGNVLPMHMDGLMINMDDSLKNKIKELIARKAGVAEDYVYAKEEWLTEWMSETWELIESRKKLAVNSNDYSMLNNFFIKTLYERDHGRNSKK